MPACRAAAILAALLLCGTGAGAATTCFGKGSTKFCLGAPGSSAYQLNCFGNRQFQSCLSQTSGSSVTSPSIGSSGATTSLFEFVTPMNAASSLQPNVDPAFGLQGAAPNPDPAYGPAPTSATDPGFTPSATATMIPATTN